MAGVGINNRLWLKVSQDFTTFPNLHSYIPNLKETLLLRAENSEELNLINQWILHPFKITLQCSQILQKKKKVYKSLNFGSNKNNVRAIVTTLTITEYSKLMRTYQRYHDSKDLWAIFLDENRSRKSPILTCFSGSYWSFSSGISLPFTSATRLRITPASFSFPCNTSQRGDSLVMLARYKKMFKIHHYSSSLNPFKLNPILQFSSEAAIWNRRVKF